MAEPKATKKEFLEFMEERELITAHSLMNQFGYSYSYACKKLSTDIMGADGYITKPFSSQELMNAIGQFLTDSK